jgi:hypothetical protein
MMLWTVYNWLPLFPTIDSEEQVLITVEDGSKIDLGVLYVNWP